MYNRGAMLLTSAAALVVAVVICVVSFSWFALGMVALGAFLVWAYVPREWERS